MKRINHNMLLAEEGDAWFRRNKDRADNQRPDIPFIIARLKNKPIAKILEIGCSSGLVLEEMTKSFDCDGYGIDASQDAIVSGKQRMEGTGLSIELVHGFSNSLPFEDSMFDLVVLGFFLYLEHRDSVVQSVSEADRVLKTGGFLVVTDFDSGNLNRSFEYTHRQDLTTYKSDYAAWLLATGHYFLADKLSFSAESEFFDENPGSRCSTQVLYKEPNPYV